ncbi:hypothetical protein ABT001_02135 [Streptomyces sp. NPDC002793]|uniref:hypothetical protein n=1 Tax=Streptomyces sp. NPDC002793 TaxID=3154432 RepID=UPI003323E276
MSRQRRRITRGLVPVCAILAGLAGCGGAGDRGSAASAAAAGFERSLARGDQEAMCSALAPETLGEVEVAEKKTCAEAIDSQGVPAGGPVRDVDVYGRQARAVLAADTLFLSEFPDGWKVVAAGCRPDRPGRPYRCAVKGG